MRPLILLAPAAVALLLSPPASAQDTGRLPVDSVRPLDTRPSIPVASPTIEPRSGSDPAGTPSPQGGDPDAPVSSDTRTGDAAGQPAGGADSPVGGVTGAGAPASDPSGAEPYMAGLPERAAPPRTLRAHWHVFIAFAIVWSLLFGYALSIGRRFGRLEDEVRRLGGPPA